MTHLSRWTALRRVALRNKNNHRGSLAPASSLATTTASPLPSMPASDAAGSASASLLPNHRSFSTGRNTHPYPFLNSTMAGNATTSSARLGGFWSGDRNRHSNSNAFSRYRGGSLSCFSTTTGDEKSEAISSDSGPEAGETAEASPSPPLLKNQKTMEFQAETKQLLDIVTHSLYTDKEVFLRELVSNASDACEKLRHLQSASDSASDLTFVDKERPLEIHIELDEVESSLTIRDTGIGMTPADIVSNLGTIARSGSKQFMNQLEQARAESSDDNGALDAAKGIIGKFGVGFYSAFMVADSVAVTSKPATVTDGEDHTVSVWTSEGIGSYELAEIDDSDEGGNTQRFDRGTTVKLFLKEDYWGLLSESKIKDVLNKYSNFVRFPIYVNGDRVNTVEAVWARDPREVDEETYSEFYKYIANAIDEPLETLHFRADAPLELRALLFVPSFHSEKYGMERMEPGVSLYSRKVLIEHKSPDILPDWMRFVKGVVDSEDLPLSISREKPQDTALIGKLKKALTRRFLSQLEKMAKKQPEKYVDEFYREYSHFLKEGICHDYEFQPVLSKLLRFETNKNTTRDLISLDTYVGNLRPEQDKIYYLTAPSREAAAMSPYLEAFEAANVEVIFIYSAIDDFVMANIGSYEGRQLVSVEKSDIDLSKFEKKKDSNDDKADSDDDKDKTSDDDSDSETKLSATEAIDVCTWMKKTLGDKKIVSCRPSSRLVNSPAIVTDNESGMMRRMMRMVDNSDGRDGMPLPAQNVEINPSHPIMVGLHQLKETEPVLARVLAEQVYDNCLVAAGLMDDSRTMLPRLNDLLVSLVKGAKDSKK
ncbi:unnamed protein product [Pseudo-nitzschia multistriata]|uniref:Histidine kinase/HSP90-like ATPase domain-containing protein n=1 Tax=Pseudo-nitzschia multistriata TaxID=183589 RepID=A0A448ZC92_9STRA|nr:unnamed protein product [Pseudo-nitzschia multistriata]